MRYPYLLLLFGAACGGEFNPDLGGTMSEGPTSTTDGSTGDGSTSGTSDGSSSGDASTSSTGDETDTGDTTGPGMDMGPDPNADLCEGGWETMLMYGESPCPGCPYKLTLSNPNMSGATVIAEIDPDFTPWSLSPDGTLVAFTREGESATMSTALDIWTFDWQNQSETQITSTLESESTPQWSPDGARFSYTRRDWTNLDIGYECWRLESDGFGNPTRIQDNPVGPPDKGDGACAWSPDGSMVAYTANFGTYSHHAFMPNTEVEVLSYMAINPLGHIEWSALDRIAVYGLAGNSNDGQIHAMDPDGGDLQQLTDFPIGADKWFSYSPDGTEMFVSEIINQNPQSQHLYTLDVETEELTPIFDGDDGQFQILDWGNCPN